MRFARRQGLAAWPASVPSVWPAVAPATGWGARPKAGFCRSEPLFKARRVSDITTSLSNQLAGERYRFEQGNQDE
ncbi:hypothetical protein MST27_11940 [Pseudomonas sp. PS1]|uniref:Uncharacterized protein n=2 Tax=Stutzerimonas marianensis TaxID=2929513 RepID=A0A9X1W3R8_9GAMM|nr:hypothetical protein [Pseudomonas marianensis]MCJ0974080.1 hypothetical protein [Pseudomonas marianensis]